MPFIVINRHISLDLNWVLPSWIFDLRVKYSTVKHKLCHCNFISCLLKPT